MLLLLRLLRYLSLFLEREYFTEVIENESKTKKKEILGKESLYYFLIFLNCMQCKIGELKASQKSFLRRVFYPFVCRLYVERGSRGELQ